MVAADGARFRGKVGTDEHRYDRLGRVRRILPDACDVALQLVHGRAHEPGGTVRLHLDYEQPDGPAVMHANQCVGLGPAVGPTRFGERSDFGGREATQKIADGIHGGRFQLFL